MISGHEKIRIPDINKKNDLVAEVNWNPYDKESNECKLIRLTMPGGKTAVVKREHFQAIVFAMAKSEDQHKLVPEVLTRVKVYETTLGITATKDIRKGEKIVVPVKFDIPISQEETIAGGH